MDSSDTSDSGDHDRRRSVPIGLRAAVVVTAGSLAFGAVSACSLLGSDANTASSTSLPAATTQPAPFPALPAAGGATYTIVDSVNLRPAADTKSKPITKIPKGTVVTAICVVIKGEPVDRAGKKSDSRWVKVASNNDTGFVSNQYIDTKADIDNPAKIPPC